MKTYFSHGFYFFLLAMLPLACSKEENPDLMINLPTVATLDYFDLTRTQVRIESRISSNGNAEISKAGVCWSTNLDPTIDENILTTQTKLGGFVLKIEALEPETVYYVRAFAENEAGLSYGNQVMFMTKEIPVFNGDISISSKAELDLFSSGEFVSVEGSLILGDASSFYQSNNLIENINGLSSIKHIEGDLIIQGNANLKSISGLSQLKIVNGDVIIYNNNNLLNLPKLQALDSIAGNLTISRNDELKSIAFFTDLTYVGGDVNITYCRELKTIEKANALVGFSGSVDVSDNYDLTNLDFLSDLESLENLYVSWNDNLTTINFASLTSTLGTLNLRYNYDLTQLNFNQLTTVGEDFILYSCDELSSLESFSNLSQVNESVIISDNDKLTSLDGLEKLEHIGDDLSIRYNYGLTDFCALTTNAINSIDNNYFYSTIYGNAFNPTVEELLAGNCSDN